MALSREKVVLDTVTNINPMSVVYTYTGLTLEPIKDEEEDKFEPNEDEEGGEEDKDEEEEEDSHTVNLEHCSHCGNHIEGYKSLHLLPLCKGCSEVSTSCSVCKKTYKIGKSPFGSQHRCSMECYKEVLKAHCYHTNVVTEHIKIDPLLLPIQEAANFYLLCDHCIDHPEDKQELDKLVEHLAHQFSRYMLFTIGGEVRYFKWNKCSYEGKDLCCQIDEKQGERIATWLTNHAYYNHTNREGMWGAWGEALEAFGELVMIRVCKILFNAPDYFFGGGNVGGSSWAKIANTLLLYWTGETTSIIFVDTAFGLYHNENIHFDKVWETWGLPVILDANQRGDMEVLRRVASKEVLEIINEQKKPKKKKK